MSKEDDKISFHVLVKAKNGKKMTSLTKEDTLAAAESYFKARKDAGKEAGRLVLTRCCLGSHTVLAKG